MVGRLLTLLLALGLVVQARRELAQQAAQPAGNAGARGPQAENLPLAGADQQPHEAPAPEAEQDILSRCQDLNNIAGRACTTESDTCELPF